MKEYSSLEYSSLAPLADERIFEPGPFTLAEQGEAFQRFLRRDLEQTELDMQRLGKEAKVTLHPARVSAGAPSSLSKVLGATGNLLTGLSEKAEHALTYESGEITMAGTLTCSNCGKVIRLRETSVVPACANCKGTTFRKGY